MTQTLVLNTLELKALIEAGVQVKLPAVGVSGQALRSYTAGEVSKAQEATAVASVEPVGREEVQCIAIADERHVYLTDDLLPTHNTSNIIFLKSTDDAMIETLEKLSGTRHNAYKNSKTVRQDLDKVGMKVEGDVSYTIAIEKEPVISFNDMAYISERNSIVFRAGDSPIWNRNETVLPMSWRLFSNTIQMPGKDFSLQTIPTTSTALQFDVRLNQPDFDDMLNRRVDQALRVKELEHEYREAFGYSDVDVARQDPDVYSDEIMNLVDAKIMNERLIHAENAGIDLDQSKMAELYEQNEEVGGAPEDNTEVLAETEHLAEGQAEQVRKRYAGGRLSRADLISQTGEATDNLRQTIVKAYHRSQPDFLALGLRQEGMDLVSADGIPYLRFNGQAALRRAQQMSEQENAYGEVEEQDVSGEYAVDANFLRYLSSFEDWNQMPNFEKWMIAFLDN